MSANLDQLRDTDFNFVRRKLREHFRRRRTAESPQEYQYANKHIHDYQEFLSDNGYPEVKEIDDLK